MTFRGRTIFWLGAVAVALAALLYVGLRSFLYPWLVMAYGWLYRLYLSIPSTLLWLGFILIVYMMAATGWLRQIGDWLLSRRWGRRDPWTLSAEPVGRAAVLARWVKRRSRGPFSRHYLKNILSELAVEKLAQAHRVAPQQIKTALERNALGLPPDIQAYLVAGLSPWPVEPLSGLRQLLTWLGLGRYVTPPDTDLERVLQFLEDKLGDF